MEPATDGNLGILFYRDCLAKREGNQGRKENVECTGVARQRCYVGDYQSTLYTPKISKQ
jgi:hypothetical protein